MSQMVLPPKGATEQIRFGSEREFLETLVKEPAVVRAARQSDRHLEAEANRRRLLASTLRVTERIVPELAAVVSTVQQIAQAMDPAEFRASVCTLAAIADAKERELGKDIF